jgi:pimeloyl-ACP methyl ester carboxylesterase
VPDDTRAALRAATLSCDGAALAELMRDHTQLDWRSLLPRVGAKAPCLVLAGAKSGVFPVEGCLEVARLAGANARAAVFDSASHWLYVEKPEQFAKVVVDFVRGEAGDEAAVVSHVA